MHRKSIIRQSLCHRAKPGHIPCLERLRRLEALPACLVARASWRIILPWTEVKVHRSSSISGRFLSLEIKMINISMLIKS